MFAQRLVKWGLAALFALAVLAWAGEGIYLGMMALWGQDNPPAQAHTAQPH